MPYCHTSASAESHRYCDCPRSIMASVDRHSRKRDKSERRATGLRGVHCVRSLFGISNCETGSVPKNEALRIHPESGAKSYQNFFHFISEYLLLFHFVDPT